MTERDRTLDIFRALTMCLMIFVNHLWTVEGVPHWMMHAQTREDFMGLADFVFPAFLFAMGMAIPYSIEHRFRKGQDAASILLHILIRGFSLVLMGVFEDEMKLNEAAGELISERAARNFNSEDWCGEDYDLEGEASSGAEGDRGETC